MTAIPPLLAIAEGRRARPRRFTAPRPREIELHLAVADLLRKLCLPNWRWSHFPAGELRDVRTGARLKKMGLARGWPDFILLKPARGGSRGQLFALELKRVGENLTEEQAAFKNWCDSNLVPHAIVRTIDEAIAVLIERRALRMGGAK